jgi:hypothetical protein
MAMKFFKHPRILSSTTPRSFKPTMRSRDFINIETIEDLLERTNRHCKKIKTYNYATNKLLINVPHALVLIQIANNIKVMYFGIP